MSPIFEDLLADVLTLPREDRAEIARQLLRSLDSAIADPSQAAWAEEIVRRGQAACDGEPGIPWEEVRRRLELKYASNG